MGMYKKIKKPSKNAARQAIRISCNYEKWQKTSTGINSMCVKGYVQPTALSEIYEVKLGYKYGENPKITILKPILIKNFNQDSIPHVYKGNKLCLHYPPLKEFTIDDFISDYIIPWISLWLYYYEIWHITGEWLGGGTNHTNIN